MEGGGGGEQQQTGKGRGGGVGEKGDGAVSRGGGVGGGGRQKLSPHSHNLPCGPRRVRVVFPCTIYTSYYGVKSCSAVSVCIFQLGFNYHNTNISPNNLHKHLSDKS